MIKYIRFKEQFDAAQMRQELACLEDELWKNHYNRSNYEGDWSTIQLRSVNGRTDNNTAIQVAALQGGSIYRDTPLMEQCGYIRQVADFFEMDKTTIRLMKLGAGAIIKPHVDDALNFEEGEVRIHIPVVTNPGLKFYLEDERLVMEEGSCWYLNLSRKHSVVNEGNTDRVHLVIDGIVNDWLRNYFAADHPLRVVMDDPPSVPMYSNEDKIKIIAQLRSMENETGNRLADEMEATLKLSND
ncbi:MAG: hypothetical protein EOO88_31480 [Pedobacter sp.]|nr:MAG: hypothetical protein EOO88_31480 [Pedobacter sp.]